MRHLGLAMLSTIFLLSTVSAAHPQSCVGAHCDVLVARLMISGEDCDTQTFDHSQTAEYSQLVTGARDFGTFPIGTLYPVVVFDERLDGSFEADDPGFAAVPSPCSAEPSISPLPPNTGLHVDLLTELPTAGGPARNLLYWDGVDDDMNGLDENDVDWSPVPLDEILRLNELGLTAVADGGTSDIEGFLIETTSGTSNIHDHIDFELRRSGGGLASFGVYLARLDLTLPGFAEGAPLYTVFATIAVPLGAEFVARTHVENQLVMPLCADGIDNDRDGFVDHAGGDPGCDSASDTSEKSPLLECDDGIDNDLDGNIDFRASDFGAADLFSTRDQECLGPSDASGEAVAAANLPALGPGGVAVLCVVLALAGARSLRSPAARRR